MKRKCKVRILTLALAVEAALVVGATGSLPARAARAATAGQGGYPNSVAVLGHSGATGESSDPNKPRHYEARENSWASGTNPAVKSLYLRLLSVNPKLEGHNFN